MLPRKLFVLLTERKTDQNLLVLNHIRWIWWLRMWVQNRPICWLFLLILDKKMEILWYHWCSCCCNSLYTKTFYSCQNFSALNQTISTFCCKVVCPLVCISVNKPLTLPVTFVNTWYIAKIWCASLPWAKFFYSDDHVTLTLWPRMTPWCYHGEHHRQ